MKAYGTRNLIYLCKFKLKLIRNKSYLKTYLFHIDEIYGWCQKNRPQQYDSIWYYIFIYCTAFKMILKDESEYRDSHSEKTESNKRILASWNFTHFSNFICV